MAGVQMHVLDNVPQRSQSHRIIRSAVVMLERRWRRNTDCAVYNSQAGSIAMTMVYVVLQADSGW